MFSPRHARTINEYRQTRTRHTRLSVALHTSNFALACPPGQHSEYHPISSCPSSTHRTKTLCSLCPSLRLHLSPSRSVDPLVCSSPHCAFSHLRVRRPLEDLRCRSSASLSWDPFLMLLLQFVPAGSSLMPILGLHAKLASMQGGGS